MEEVKRWDIAEYPYKKNWARKAVFSLLKSFSLGSLSIELPNGDIVQTGDEAEASDAVIQIKNERFFKRCVLGGDIAFGEAYVDGDWDTPDITAVIRWMIKNVENSGVMSGSKSKTAFFNLLGQANRLGHLVKRNTKAGSKNNISFHYDLSNDFYAKWLDPTMTYSCGYFADQETSLEQAQVNKYQLLCDDLAIQPADHVLEIGCGWGGFMEHAVSKYGCKYTGVTISIEQLNFAKQRAKALGIEDKVSLLFCDYRDLEGKFDKIVSIEMIEAVGHEFLPVYFGKLQSLLKKEGLLTIQVITSPDARYNEFRKGVDWIQKHIFPGSLLPSVEAMTRAVRKTGDMHLVNLRDIGTHYAKTLNQWRDAFNKEWSEIHPLGFDQAFRRKWNYYLSYCEAAFEMRNISDVQLTWSRPNNTSF
tara:strand:- start:22418 stop:23671 length:1254 start_codon:yes stop_codon:yes gene_type:complete